ncbi:hypothetical protein KVR01_012916 [Diaporthe batatas]|uniref:uncharacterized protein n=1 Tax=Diaporthe batatas TaxID=748121 RepID=UPI001D0379D3|nr:uncharacterized protein KVR01_012916 [Diaporthe batatas]KAG8157208.1 hypothetical protein KVR01_012916 [Diaporthe batatas]
MAVATRCNDCRKWKAHKAFVRSRVKRDSVLWHQKGYMWHKYKSCNQCFRTYRNRGMSVQEFIKVFGAEEHNSSEPEILIDEFEAQKILDMRQEVLDKRANDNNTKDEAAEPEPEPEPEQSEAAKMFEKHIKFEDKNAEYIAVTNLKYTRLMEWLDGASCEAV